MKVQVQHQQLRLRIDEAELAQLRDGRCVENATWLPGGTVWSISLTLHDGGFCIDADAAPAVAIRLPRAEVLALAARLPCREGLGHVFPAGRTPALHLRFDIDVRDSVRQRRPVTAATRARPDLN